MGTKNNPGRFDCFTAAEPDEPMFTLLGRDPMAGSLVRQWAHQRNAVAAFGGKITEDLRRESDKIEEAFRCADAMDQWAYDHGKKILVCSGQKAYEAYGGMTSKECANWDSLSSQEKEAWESAALAVQK